MRFVLVFALVLSGCAILKRSPSSINGGDSLFNLGSSEDLLQTRYSFELYNIKDLSEKRISFKAYDVAVTDSKRALEAWVSDLHNYLETKNTDLYFKTGTQEISISAQDMVRLDQALTQVAKLNDSPEAALKRQVELITAFNHQFKKEVLSAEAASVPIEFYSSSASTVPSVVENSSFWTSPADYRQNFRPVDFSAEELTKIRCKSDGSDSRGKSISLSCGPAHFKIAPQNSSKVAVLNSILYRRLGYNTPPMIYQPRLELEYDHSAVGKIKELNLNAGFVLKNGEILNFSQVTEKLIPYCKTKDSKCYSKSALFDQNFETQIEKIVISEVALTVDFGDHEFGSWSYEDLDHRYRREVKGLLFVGALTGNNDLRKENNALVWSAKSFSISHQVQNVSSGLARLHTGTTMNLNAMNWEVLKTKKSPKGTTFYFDGYRPLVKRQAFSEITLDDAKWAVRQIAGVSEGEITEALYHSGFSVAETLLAREKLLSIQKNMVESLQLSSEFPALASRKIDKNLNYRIQRRIQSFDLSATRSVHVPEADDELYNGVLRKKISTEK